MMKCPKCQYENADTAKFCRKCGEKLSAVKADKPQQALFCNNCGAPLKAGAKFCAKCGKPIAQVQPAPVHRPAPAPEPVQAWQQQEPMQEAKPLEPQGKTMKTDSVTISPPVFEQNPSYVAEPASQTLKMTPPLAPSPISKSNIGLEQEIAQNLTKGKKSGEKNSGSGMIIVACILGAVIIIGGLFAFLLLQGVFPFGNERKNTETEVTDEENGEGTGGEEVSEETSVSEAEVSEETSVSEAEVESLMTPVSDLISESEEMLNNNNYEGAVSTTEEAISQAVAISRDNDLQDAAGEYVELAYAAYSNAVLKQTADWETKVPSAAWYQQIDQTLIGALDMSLELEEEGYTVDTTELKNNKELLPERYKEKYILIFNDLRTGEDWSRTTAWQYMQDAASVNLVDKASIDDPLTLRYAYALAWITQKELSEGIADGSVTAQDAIDTIVSLAESTDYNPVLMRDLASYLQAAQDTTNAELFIEASSDVWEYLAFTENVYILPSDMLVTGKANSNASSTIELYDFYYFNDFGEYSLSTTNGVSPQGRQAIRDIYKGALASYSAN